MPEIVLDRDIVLNRKIGGFSLSRDAVREYAARKGLFFHSTEKTYWASTDEAGEDIVDSRDIPRDDADLVAIVRQMGEAAGGEGTRLQVKTVAVRVKIKNHAGFEEVAVFGWD